MSTLLPGQWKEGLGRLYDKAMRLLHTFKPETSVGTREHISGDRLPAFMQFGVPPLDVFESSDELIVTAEVPGLNSNDVSIELTGKHLTIHGEKKTSCEHKNRDGSYLSECSYGRFSRSVRLPYDIKDNSAKAELSNGVLTIRIPKPASELKQRHRIPIA